MKLRNFTLLLSLATHMGCSTPAAPTPPQSSSVASKANGEATQGASAPGGAPQTGAQVPTVVANSTDAYLGAKVGPDALRKSVHDCNVAGSYYNRSTRICDQGTKLAAFPCKEDAIRASAGIRPAEMATFNDIVLKEINNPDPNLRFLFDQCVIPTTPDSDTGKIYRLKIYLAKLTKVGDAERIDTKVLRFEP